MLWYGTVLDDEPSEPSARGVKELTRLLFASAEFATTLVPLRDGVTVSIRKG
jgi:predicted O-methyltransferase YrrM